MLRNYLLIALRLLRKNKAFSIINIFGLSIGIACCILITLFIQDEFSFEKAFPEYQKVFRINTTFIMDGVSETGGFTSPPIAIELGQTLPEIELATRVMKVLNVEQHIIWYKDKSFFESDAFLVDSTFLQMFPYRLSEGNPANALNAPSTVVLSEKLRRKIFQDGPALDELLIINSGQSADTFRVTGVIAPSKFPSHLDADIYMSMNSNGWGKWVLSQTTWSNNNMVGSYVKLRDPVAVPAVNTKMAEQMEIHAGDELRQSGRQKILKLQALDDIRLYSELRQRESNGESSAGIMYIYIIGTIGILILLLACINFMNLTTARSAQRSGEVGIRKSMGAYKSNLVGQFLGESMVIVVFALVLSFVLVLLGLPGFNSIMQKELSLNSDNLPFIASAAIVIAGVTGIIAGSYPAFFLSSLKPTQTLKGKSLTGDGSQWLRKGLVVFQFVITITLISSIVIIQRQLEYIQSKSLGFNTDQIIMLPLRTGQAAAQYVSMKEAFGEINGVNAVSGTSSIPSTPLFRDWGMYKEGSTNDQSIRHEIVSVDQDYFRMLDVEMIAGRDFDPAIDNLASDTSNVSRIIVNEASLMENGIALDEAVGTSLNFEPVPGTRYIFNIIGVVKDFHQFSLHRKISPMVFMLPGERDGFSYLAASIDMKSYKDVSTKMKELWEQRINDAPFENVFLNDNVKKLYSADARISSMLTISTVIALVISCLGLYGLSVYVAERKTKEIGIRKVVGASVGTIIGMLSKEYIKLIILSFVISAPIGYYFMDRWLQSFAYRIEPGFAVFLISGCISFAIAWLTISFESFRAANRNPVETLRSN
jgi:putative ABC transport system permease protein